MLELILVLLAAAVFACVGVTAEKNKQHFITGCCVVGCVVAVVAAGFQVIFMLIAEGWQP